MRKLPLFLLRRLRDKLAKRTGWASKTVSKPKKVYNAEFVPATAAKPGSMIAEGGIVRYGRTGMEKVAASEGAVYNKLFKPGKILKPSTLGGGAAATEKKLLDSVVSKSTK